MKKLLILLLVLMLSMGLWAMDGVHYINANGQEQTANNVTEITNSSSGLSAGWYIVNGTNVQTGTLTCQGAVHLILADGAKLTTEGWSNEEDEEGLPGIQVSGDGNSLTIYGQTAQSGQLIAQGGWNSAGIGGGKETSGSNITVNGGKVTATGGPFGAGIGGGYWANGFNITINGGIIATTGGEGGAGIGGGGESGDGYNITINGGTVTATGEGWRVSGIGGGESGSGYNIFVTTKCIVKADEEDPPTAVIANDGSDLAEALQDKHFVTIVPDPVVLSKERAIAEIQAAVKNDDPDEVKTIANNAVPAVNAATTLGQVDATRTFALAAIASAKAMYSAGKAEGYKRAYDELPTDAPDTPGVVVIVTKGEKTLKLVNPDAVEYDKQE